MIASVFITISVLFDMGVWYFVKNLVVFDDVKVVDETHLEILPTKEKNNDNVTRE